MFGPTRGLENQYAQLVRTGRLQFVGPITEKDLIRYYHRVDCVVHTEKFAGWANLVAEAMSCELPVICTPHGTSVFAIHNQNSIVLNNPNSHCIAKAVMALSKNSYFSKQLAKQGRQTMMDFTWSQYAKQMLNLIFDSAVVDSNEQHYPRQLQ